MFPSFNLLPNLHIFIIIVILICCTFVFQVFVSLARRKYKVIAPQTSGNENFEIAYRVHQNQLEANALMVPLLILNSLIIAQGTTESVFVICISLLWLISRICFSISYYTKQNAIKLICSILATVSLLILIAFTFFTLLYLL